MKEIDIYQVDAFASRLFAEEFRGGELKCELHGDRVHISGQARTYMQGKVFLP